MNVWPCQEGDKLIASFLSAHGDFGKMAGDKERCPCVVDSASETYRLRMGVLLSVKERGNMSGNVIGALRHNVRA